MRYAHNGTITTFGVVLVFYKNLASEVTRVSSTWLVVLKRGVAESEMLGLATSFRELQISFASGLSEGS